MHPATNSRPSFRRHGFRPGTRQRGQALVWFLAMAAACCAVLALVYNVGQATNEKEKMLNAADASAMSAALIEARMLNFEAYANRGMIANEVTVAQLLSLDSWIRYDSKLLSYIALYTSWIPYVDEVTEALSNAADGVRQGIDAIVQPGIYAAEAAETALWAARENANWFGVLAANQIAGRVAGANKTTFGTGAGRFDTTPELNSRVQVYAGVVNELAWLQFTQANTGDDRKAAKAVILNSRDQFSTKRDAGKLLDYVNWFLGLPGKIGWDYIQFDKTSGSSNLENYDHWEAQDSADLSVHSISCHTTSSFPYFSCGWEKDYIPYVPIGYGRADAGKNSSTGKNLCTEKTPTDNCQYARSDAAHYNYTGPLTLTGTHGMPNIRDLTSRLTKDSDCSKYNGTDAPSLSYLVVVEKSAAATMSTQRLGAKGFNSVDVKGPQGSPRLEDNFQNGDKLASFSAGCTFFLRPDKNTKDVTLGKMARDDGIHEYASLYNPYWQARLGTVGRLNKGLVYGLMGLNPLLAAATP